MLSKENRLFDDDPLEIAVGRVIFIQWMKKNNKWGEYINYMRKLSLSTINWEMDYYENSWRHPKTIFYFLGGCSFDYENACKPWKEICNDHLSKLIKSKTNNML